MEAVSLPSLVFVVHFKVLATSTVYGETVDACDFEHFFTVKYPTDEDCRYIAAQIQYTATCQKFLHTLCCGYVINEGLQYE